MGIETAEPFLVADRGMSADVSPLQTSSAKVTKQGDLNGHHPLRPRVDVPSAGSTVRANVGDIT